MEIFFIFGPGFPMVNVLSEVQGILLKKPVIKVDKTSQEKQQLKSTQKTPDRRGYPRLSKHLRVNFRKMDSMEEYRNAATDDISMGGFRVDVAFLGSPLQVNQVIEITIANFRENPEPIKAIGRVVWIKDNEDNYSYEIGISFTYIKDKDKECFMKYMCEQE